MVHVTHTPAEPPNRGRRFLATMGWIKKSSAALPTMVTELGNCCLMSMVNHWNSNRSLCGLICCSHQRQSSNRPHRPGSLRPWPAAIRRDDGLKSEHTSARYRQVEPSVCPCTFVTD